ncbi:MAG: leucine-rich repeat domain-containing protein [Saprospiraceae bacterium]
MKLKLLILLSSLSFSFLYAQSPANLTADVTVSKNFSSVTATENTFNNARRQEETQLSLSPNSITNLDLPAQSVWDGYTEKEQLLYLLNDERIARAGINYGNGPVLGLPFQGIEGGIDGVAQNYAQTLLDNDAFTHNYGGTSPSSRIDSAISSACRETISRSENIYAAVSSSSGAFSTAVESAIFNWNYDDASSNWGHREMCLLQNQTLTTTSGGFQNNNGATDKEGYIGIGIAKGENYAGFGTNWPYGAVIVLNYFDPLSDALAGNCMYDAGGNTGTICNITDLSVDSISNCNTTTGVYDVDVTVNFSAITTTSLGIEIPGLGYQYFAVEGGDNQTKTFTLTGLPANGQLIRFEKMSICNNLHSRLPSYDSFTAPSNCDTETLLYEITSFDIGTIHACNPETNTFNVDITVSFSAIYDNSNIHIRVSSLPDVQFFTVGSGNNQTQTFTVKGLPADGNSVGVRQVSVSGGNQFTGKAYTNNHFTAPVSCEGTCPGNYTIINELVHGTYQASQTLQTQGTVIAVDTAIVVFKAASSVTLNPGFRVMAGGEFSAEIGNCIDTTCFSFEVVEVDCNLQVTVSDGVAPYNIVIKGLVSFTVTDTASIITIENLVPGNYQITVNDAKTCKESKNVSFAGDCSSSCRMTDSLALVALYNVTDGVNWTNIWDLNTPINTWHGVTTNDNGCVITLDLNNNQLTGTIPIELGNLGNLQTLYLYTNQLTGTIPSALSSLTNLERLYLYDNQLTGTIPSEIGNLTKLQYLYLSQNQLTGVIPTSLGNLTDLRHFYLYENELTGTIPVSFGNFTNIQRLYLYDNLLTGAIPTSLGNLTSLLKLFLNNNQLTGSIPTTLGNLTNLEFLYLYDNLLTGNIPSELSNLSNLQKLYLNTNQLTGSIPPSLGNLTNLEYLYLYENQLTGSLPISLGNLANLQRIYLYQNQLSGCFPQSFSALCNISYSFVNNPNLPGGGDFPDFCTNSTGICIGCRTTDSLALVALYNTANGPNWTRSWNLNQPMNTWYGVSLNATGCVTSLYLYNNNLIDSIPPELGNLSKLTSLNLERNLITSSIPPELGNLSNLTTLNLYNTRLTGNIPPELGNLSNLVSFRLYTRPSTGKAISGSIPPELGNLVNLQYLFLVRNRLSGDIPVELGNLTKLKELSLGSNFLTGDIPAELGNLTNLLELNLGDNSLTGDIPTELGNLANLKELSLGANILTGIIPIELGNLSNIENLYLANNKLSGIIPSSLGNLSKMERLALDKNNLTGNIPSELGNLTNLTSFRLSENQLTNSIPSSLGNLTNVTYLDFSKNQLSESIPPELGNMTNLRYIRLNTNLLTGSIPSELANLNNLVNLISSDNQLSGCFAPELTALCDVGVVNFTFNPNLPGNGDFAAFCANGTGGCTSLSDSNTASARSTTINQNQNNIENLKLSIVPNPVKNEAKISYTIPKSGKMSLTMYDIQGSAIETLEINDFKEKGAYQLVFPAFSIPSGIYFIRLETEMAASVEKIIVLD